WTNRLLAAQIGVAGVAGVLAFVFMAALIIVYNLDFKIKRKEKPEHLAELNSDEHEQSEGQGEMTERQTHSGQNNRIRHEDAEIMPDSEYLVDPVEFDLNEQEDQSQSAEIANKHATPEESPEFELPAVLPEEPSLDAVADAAAHTVEIVETPATPALTVEAVKEEKSISSDDLVEQFGQYDPKLDLSGYKHPS